MDRGAWRATAQAWTQLSSSTKQQKTKTKNFNFTVAPGMRLRCEIIKETNFYQAKSKSNSQSRPGTDWAASEGHDLPLLKLLKQTPLGEQAAHRPQPRQPWTSRNLFPGSSTDTGCSVTPSPRLESLQSLGCSRFVIPFFTETGGAHSSFRCWQTGGLMLTQALSVHPNREECVFFCGNPTSLPCDIYTRAEMNKLSVCIDPPVFRRPFFFFLFLTIQEMMYNLNHDTNTYQVCSKDPGP